MKEFVKKNWKLILAIIYIISPLDFIPDVLLPVGLIDDLGILVATLILRYLEYKKEKKGFDFKNDEILEGETVE